MARWVALFGCAKAAHPPTLVGGLVASHAMRVAGYAIYSRKSYFRNGSQSVICAFLFSFGMLVDGGPHPNFEQADRLKRTV